MSQTRNVDLSALRIQRNEKEENTPKRTGKVVTACIVLIIIFAGWYFLRNVSFSSQEVELATASLVSSSQSNSVLTASGYVVAQRKAAVSSKSTGKLVVLNVIEGDIVRQNQVIGKIESAEVEAMRDQLRAALDVAKADAENAKAEVDDAKLDLERKTKLSELSAAPRIDYDNAKARLNKATAGYSARLAAVKMAEANLKNADVQVENTIIRAPFDGTVLTKNANVGEVITALGAAAGARGAVVTIADMNSLEVEADVSESNIERIISDQQCEITLDAYPEKRYRGFVSKIIPTADRAKATVQVKVRFEERDDRVLPEMSAKVLFLKANTAAKVNSEPPKIMIPVDAMMTRDSKNYVYVVSDEKAKEVEIQIGSVANSLVEVSAVKVKK